MPDDRFFVSGTLGMEGHPRVVAAAVDVQRVEDLGVDHCLPMGGDFLHDRQPADLMPKTQAESLIDQQARRAQFVQRGLPVRSAPGDAPK